jgi:hypothetical protein
MDDRGLLRHALAVLAYRAGKCLRDAPPEFARFSTGDGAWRPLHLATHLADLMAWAVTVVRGVPEYQDSTPAGWDEEVARFYARLAELDAHLAGDAPVEGGCERLLAGPVADALTHVGQLAMLRRMAGVPVVAESFYRAEIVTGRVGREQAEPVRVFVRRAVD